MTVVLVAADVEAEEFVKLALAARRRRTGAYPVGLILATAGQEWTVLAAATAGVDDADVVPMVMTKTRAATELGVSPKTVQRLTGSGKLPTVKMEGRSMVRRIDLEEYVAKLRKNEGTTP